MSDHDDTFRLRLLPTGVPGLDEVLGGGLPEYSLFLLAGAPGSGKTTLAHQIAFAHGTEERPVLYFTVLGEPTLKMLRFQRQMAFFDLAKIGGAIQFVDLSAAVLEGDLGKVLARIVDHIERVNPAFVMVDSFRTVVRANSGTHDGEVALQQFVQKLALYLASFEATSFLIGEYGEAELVSSPVSTITDGILLLSQFRERNSSVRKLQVTKLRGAEPMSGMHTARISTRGVQVFPRNAWQLPGGSAMSDRRVGSGVPGLDPLIGGGFIEGDATLVAGPSGSGKSLFATHFIAEGVRCGDRAVLAIFEEDPVEYLARAKSLGFDLDQMVRDGQIELVTLRPRDLSAEEVLFHIHALVRESGARRLVVDSLNGLEMALSPSFREEFRESLFRLVGGLTRAGISVLMTVEVTESFDQIMFSPHAISFVSQNIFFLRYVEMEGALKKVLAIVKMRRSEHSRQLHGYEITGSGIQLTEPMTAYRDILTGRAKRIPLSERTLPGLTGRQQQALEALSTFDQASEATMRTVTGLEAAEVRATLNRLVELGHALAHGENEDRRYRVTSRPLVSGAEGEN